MLEDFKSYKTPELQKIEEQLLTLQRDIAFTLKAIEAGTMDIDGKLPVVQLGNLLDKLRVKFADWTGANNQQEAYQQFIANMEEAVTRRANALYAQGLVFRLTQLEDDITRLNQIASDDGSSAVGFYSLKAREAGLPADVVRRVADHVNSQMDALSNDIFKAVAADINASRQPADSVPV